MKTGFILWLAGVASAGEKDYEDTSVFMLSDPKTTQALVHNDVADIA